MRILYENGKKVGEIEDWVLTERQAEKRVVLGKEIFMPKPKDQVTFASPKVVGRKSDLVVIDDNKIHYRLDEIKVKAGTLVTASVAERTRLDD